MTLCAKPTHKLDEKVSAFGLKLGTNRYDVSHAERHSQFAMLDAYIHSPAEELSLPVDLTG